MLRKTKKIDHGEQGAD